MPQPTCTVDGCQKPSRNTKSAAMCKMHYHRWYRHGSTEKVAHQSGVTVSLGRRYRTRYAPGHPIAVADGKIYVHRMVLFDGIGPGQHECHWCRTTVEWLPKGSDGELQVDHLDNDGANNSLENLVPACRNCNGGRGAQRRADALRDAGWWSNHDTIAELKSQGRRARVEQRAS